MMGSPNSVNLLDTARAVLETLGMCHCVDIEVGGIDAKSFLATQKHVWAGSPRRVILARDAGHVDVARWAGNEDNQDTFLFVLVSDEAEVAAAQGLCELAARHGRRAVAQRWSEFLPAFVNLPRIQDHYRRLREDYRESEGEGFVYIDPNVVDEDDQRGVKLSNWVRALEDRNAGGIVYLVAEYGEGKTSFCLNYVFRCLARTEMNGAIPLLFMLNECEAGSLKAFVVQKLRKIAYDMSASCKSA